MNVQCVWWPNTTTKCPRHIRTSIYNSIYNIRTLSVNINFICTSFRNRQNSKPSASFSGLFRSKYKWILYLTTMYVFCVYPAMSKKSENLVRFRQKGQKQASFLAFHKCCQGCLLLSYLSAPSAVHSYRVSNKIICPAISTFAVQIC
jgi:hypothetical protein